MNVVATIALAGVLAQSQGAEIQIPHCEGHCTRMDFEGDPLKDQEVAGELQMPTRWTAADVHRALETASPRARCIVRSEVGGVGYSPWAVGRAGELGPVQLHPRGLLADYTRWSGGRAPQDPVWSIRYLDAMLAAGRGSNWSAVLAGRC